MFPTLSVLQLKYRPDQFQSHNSCFHPPGRVKVGSVTGGIGGLCSPVNS